MSRANEAQVVSRPAVAAAGKSDAAPSPAPKKKGFFSDIPLEAELTPYEAWTTGELAPRHTQLDVGLRARAARETGPGGVGTHVVGGSQGTGGQGNVGGLQYLGPDFMPGETREERDMRLFLARGEGVVAAHALLNDPVSRNRLEEKRGTERGTIIRGSVRPEEPAVHIQEPASAPDAAAAQVPPSYNVEVLSCALCIVYIFNSSG